MKDGFYLMHRGWMDNPVFKKEPYTEAQAWEWMISEAAFVPHEKNIKGQPIKLGRGQFSHSTRFMAEKFQWNKNKITRFLKKLENRDMVRTKTGAGQLIVTICNYTDYQDGTKKSGTQTGQQPGHARDSDGTKNKEGINKDKQRLVTGDEKNTPTNQPNFVLLNDFENAIPRAWADWVHENGGMSDGDIIAEAKKLADKSRAKGADKITFRQWKGWVTAEIKFRQESRTAASGTENNLPVKKPERELEPWEQQIAEHIGKTQFLAWCDGAKLEGSTLIVETAFKKDHLRQHFDQKLKRAGVTEVQHQGEAHD